MRTSSHDEHEWLTSVDVRCQRLCRWVQRSAERGPLYGRRGGLRRGSVGAPCSPRVRPRQSSSRGHRGGLTNSLGLGRGHALVTGLCVLWRALPSAARCRARPLAFRRPLPPDGVICVAEADPGPGFTPPHDTQSCQLRSSPPADLTGHRCGDFAHAHRASGQAWRPLARRFGACEPS